MFEVSVLLEWMACGSSEWLGIFKAKGKVRSSLVVT